MSTPQPEAGPSLSDEYALLEEDVLAETSAGGTTTPNNDGDNAEQDDEAVKKGVEALRELFPDHSEELLRRAVLSHPNNIDFAASVVANGAVSDEQLAISLQAEETRRSRARTASTPQQQQQQYSRNIHGNNAGIPSISTFRPTARVLARAVEVLRDVVIPTVHTRLKSLSFSNVHLVNMYLSLAIGKFHYESTGFIPWNDEGSLDTSVAGLTAVAALVPTRTNSGAVRLLVRDIDVRIEGNVRVRTVGTSADWAYNTLAAVCKPLITSYIKDTIGTQLKTTLTQELRDFRYLPPADEQDGTATAGTEAPVLHESSVAPVQASIELESPSATSAPS